MQDVLEGITSYIVAFGLLIAHNTDSILAWGGIALLVIRLIADTPRAWANIKGWFRNDN